MLRDDRQPAFPPLLFSCSAHDRYAVFHLTTVQFGSIDPLCATPLADAYWQIVGRGDRPVCLGISLGSLARR
jgi:hypothetical protein